VGVGCIRIDGLYYSYAVCEDDQSYPKAYSGAPYDPLLNDAVKNKSYAAYTAQTCPYTGKSKPWILPCRVKDSSARSLYRN
jgi:hypothetical protein